MKVLRNEHLYQERLARVRAARAKRIEKVQRREARLSALKLHHAKAIAT
jgi:hypothetical protein